MTTEEASAMLPHYLLKQQIIETPYEIQDNTIYTAVNVNDGSESAIVSFAFSDNRLVVVGFEIFEAHSASEPRKHLYAHVDSLTKKEEFAACKITLILEAAIGTVAQNCAHAMLHRYPEKVAVMCSRENLYGVLDNCFNADQTYVESLCDRVSKNGLFVDNTMVCNAFPNKRSLDKIDTSLFSIPARIDAPSSLSNRVHVTYDTLATTLGFGLHYCNRFKLRSNTSGLGIQTSKRSHEWIPSKD